MINNKIFNLGFSRTGTTSLAALCQKLGIRSVHDSKELFGYFHNYSEIVSYYNWNQFELYSGLLCPMWLEIVENSYGCKFILTVRDVETWKVSADRHFQGGWSVFRTFMFSEVGVPYNDGYIDVYNNYNSSIIEYFKDNDLPLLLIDFENDENIVEKICDFLNIEKVDVEVPWANKEGCYQDQGLWKRLNNIKE